MSRIRIDRLAALFASPQFVSMLGHVRADMIAAEAAGEEYSVADAAAALCLPVALCEMLFAWNGAWKMEQAQRLAGHVALADAVADGEAMH